MLNPLLGENLGRWAEVYFTSSPETREQALRDLLLELQAEHSSPADSGFPETDLVQPQPTVGESVKKPGWPVVRPSRSESIADPRGKNWYSRLARVPHRSYLFAASGFALAGILVLALVLAGVLIGILLLRRGRRRQGSGREQRDERSFHTVCSSCLDL